MHEHSNAGNAEVTTKEVPDQPSMSCRTTAYIRPCRTKLAELLLADTDLIDVKKKLADICEMQCEGFVPPPSASIPPQLRSRL